MATQEDLITIKKFKNNRTVFRLIIIVSIISSLFLMFFLKNNFLWSDLKVPLIGIHYGSFVPIIVFIFIYYFSKKIFWVCPSCKSPLEIGDTMLNRKSSDITNCNNCGVPFEYNIEKQPSRIEENNKFKEALKFLSDEGIDETNEEIRKCKEEHDNVPEDERHNIKLKLDFLNQKLEIQTRHLKELNEKLKKT
jgi:transcription elongation factor Elf1